LMQCAARPTPFLPRSILRCQSDPVSCAPHFTVRAPGAEARVEERARGRRADVLRVGHVPAGDADAGACTRFSQPCFLALTPPPLACFQARKKRTAQYRQFHAAETAMPVRARFFEPGNAAVALRPRLSVPPLLPRSSAAPRAWARPTRRTSSSPASVRFWPFSTPAPRPIVPKCLSSPRSPPAAGRSKTVRTPGTPHRANGKLLRLRLTTLPSRSQTTASARRSTSFSHFRWGAW